MDNILRNIPDSFESERLLIRSPRPGDGAMVNAAVLDSLAALRPWMVWAQQTPTVDDNERYTREAHIRFLKREELPLLLLLKGTEIMVGSSGLHRINWAGRAHRMPVKGTSAKRWPRLRRLPLPH